jgi:ubiquinone/menaquinone biosynthesis C-methylase UbiE
MRRINRPELMDEAQDPRELAGDLRNLERINRFLGGRSLIRRQLAAVLRRVKPGSPCVLLDVATGGGDLPRDVAARFRGRGLAAIVAVDRNPQMLEYARSHSNGVPEIRFVRADALCLPLASGSADVVLCSLALHHFTEPDAVALLRELARVARRALIINDLRRSPTAYVLIWLITRFCRNRMTRYDGPLSVRRAFTMAEVRRLAQAAGLDGAHVVRQLFFRQALVWERGVNGH